jgi:hypothetical protein
MSANEPVGHSVASRKHDERTHRSEDRQSKTRRTNPPIGRSRVENVPNEPAGYGSSIRKHNEPTHPPLNRMSKAPRIEHGKSGRMRVLRNEANSALIEC